MIRALIVDDEPPARARLERMLGEHPDVEVVAAVGDVPAAMRRLAQDRPDTVFLDVRLPGDDGFTLLELLGRSDRPAVVCTTAYADHAVRAFDERAVDYLLKPFSRERLAEALARVREHHRPVRPAGPAPARRIPVPGPTGIGFVDVRRVESVRAERNYVRVHTDDRRVLLRATLREMEDRLPGQEFVRVNRSVIVRIDRVVELQPLPHGEVALRLASGDQVVSGRSHAAVVRAALGL
ncbi:two component transcriptional regulator, LytTR family [Kribbella flavida DSM 17836]|uniref:Two component transcriptional regulator, LytTR family n=1 Tax=Kribbella flavida (strain DSM 17836 / JCM 10339 / NBRC 14399) TaxID=479435 RepID=D2PNH6_KRIFD|nr:LytTR family DNA-binding domain-containing protein [Kribbella flavida]ADB30828.1 two component transcriptional regulator, LytTR family [Kribbella flavida DSM 17836]